MRTRGSVQVAPEVFLKACLFGTQKGVGHGDQADMMVPSPPLAALVVVQSEFFFQFAVILFDPPARLGDAHAVAPSRPLRTKLNQPVFRGLLLVLRPFHQQPFFDPQGMGLLPPPVGRPNRQQGKAGALRSPAALPPGQGAPSRHGNWWATFSKLSARGSASRGR